MVPTFKKKLVLNKETVVNLDNGEMKLAKGGTELLSNCNDCFTIDTRCDVCTIYCTVGTLCRPCTHLC
ncbi:MAG: hypothetical protein GTO45_20650 [Candidatus Aminicenantes bacterium]|nr:hypothetical protein [Candidatus Aminicenantes bacterium]NIM81199.1 hypothetical protein [Candidatus Aminicenantes bacterium]NIN20574.1 hypothetical protein [Candidatus Aminicenantes bacterium]NIN44353.1 hypothetical protein [Candidatus Aminicenantes bacterium]NIN87172.1 hypothetical protein [Candidatus Aminicenantes bacterium]